MQDPRSADTAKSFSRQAAAYAESRSHAYGEDLDIVAAYAEPGQYFLCLDIACGPGHTAFRIASKASVVIGIDIAEGMLAKARELAAAQEITNVVFQKADAAALPFRDASFDLVTCRIAPHHFPDLPAAVREVMRVTRPGGLVGIIDSVVPDDPALDAFLNGVEKVRDPTHVRSYRIEEWNEILEPAGLFLLHVSRAWKAHPFAEWVARTVRPPEVQREIESLFLKALPRARKYYRIRIENGRVVSYSDEKGIFVGRKQ